MDTWRKTFFWWLEDGKTHIIAHAAKLDVHFGKETLNDSLQISLIHKLHVLKEVLIYQLPHVKNPSIAILAIIHFAHLFDICLARKPN